MNSNEKFALDAISKITDLDPDEITIMMEFQDQYHETFAEPPADYWIDDDDLNQDLEFFTSKLNHL